MTTVNSVRELLSRCGELLCFDSSKGLKFRVGKSIVTHPIKFVENPDYLAELERQINILCEVKEVETTAVDIPNFDNKDLSNAGGFANRYYNNSTGVQIPVFNRVNDTFESIAVSR